MTSRKSNREIGDAYEKKILEQLGGRRISGSGSSRELKEDGDFPRAKMQIKFTSAKSISIQAKDLVALQENAMNCGKVPVLVFGVDGAAEEWVAVPLWVAKKAEWFKDFLGVLAQ